MHALLDIVLPVFGIVLLGYGSGRFGILGEASSEALNKFVFFFGLPPLIFLSTARAPIGQVLNWPFIAAYMLGVAATFAVAMAGSRLLFGLRDIGPLTIHGLAASFTNTAFMGIPLFVAAFGPGATLLPAVATMFQTLIIVGGAILVLDLVSQRPGAAEHSGAGGRTARGVLADIWRTLWRNPMLTAPFLGTLVAALAVPLPSPLTRLLDLLGAAAAPAALFAIGISLYGRSLAGHLREVAWLTLLKLLFQPLVTWLLVRFVFRLDPFAADAAVLLAALPAGALVFVVAQRFEVRVATGSAAIIVTTGLSILTLAALLVAMGIG